MCNRYEQGSSEINVLISTTFNDAEQLARLLEDLISQSVQVGKVIIIFQRAKIKAFKDISVHKFIEKFKAHLPIYYEIHDEVGLSKSRNRALKAATGEILLLADDDCRYPADAIKQILTACNQFPDADVLTFQIRSNQLEKPFKAYPHKPYQHNLRTLMKVSSIEIVLRRKVLTAGAGLFDERFGLGALWPSGEEFIMLADLYRRGYAIQYVPITIVCHNFESSGRSFNLDVLRAKGAMFHRVFGRWGLIVLVFFLAKKKWSGALKYSLVTSFIQALKGYREFKNLEAQERKNTCSEIPSGPADYYW